MNPPPLTPSPRPPWVKGPLPGHTPETSDAGRRPASELDGAWALAVGLAANESFRSGEPVDVHRLLDL